MTRFHKGDRVRIDIPEESDPDHSRLHGQHGEIVDTIGDDAGEETGDERDSLIYRVELDDGRIEDVRWRDIRPPIE